jgi:hypothetical protein
MPLILRAARNLVTVCACGPVAAAGQLDNDLDRAMRVRGVDPPHEARRHLALPVA